MSNRMSSSRGTEKPFGFRRATPSLTNMTLRDSVNSTIALNGDTLSRRETDMLHTLPSIGDTARGLKGLNMSTRSICQESIPKPPVESDEQIKRRLKLTRTVATQLMKASMDRQPNIFPLFVSNPETGNPHLVDEERGMRPEHKKIVSPCFGIAAGAHAMGGYSTRCAMSNKAAEQLIERERASNHVLFSWWETRNAVRLSEEEVKTVEEELRGPIWSCFRNCLTEEEGLLIQSLSQAYQDHVAEMSQRYTGRLGASSPAQPFAVADRGICLPIDACERIFEKVMDRTHRRLLALLRCLAASETDGVEFALGSPRQGSQYVQSLLRAQIEMIDTSKGFGSEIPIDKKTDSGNVVAEAEVRGLCSVPAEENHHLHDTEENAFCNRFLPLVSIPKERCFHPLLCAETALASAVLWRILDQSREIAPAMNWALQLFTKYIMPHVYENFKNYEHLFPRAGSLGEQVDCLHALQLNLIQQRGMVSATRQAKEDVRYMELVMKSWSWRAWRQNVMGRKRRDKVLDRVGDEFRRLHLRLRLLRCFNGWRLATKEGGFSAQLDFIDLRYSSFLEGAQHAARDVRLFPGMDDGPKESVTNVVDKHKFIAFKLAETAQHVKKTELKRKPTFLEPNEEAEQEPGVEKKLTQVMENKGQQSFNRMSRKELRRSLLSKVAGKEEGDEESKGGKKGERGGNSLDSEKIPDEFHSDRRLTARSAFLKSFSSIGTEGVSSQRILESKDSESPMEEANALQNRAIDTFEDMLRKLHEMESISGYLRQEIAIQNRLIKKLERENINLKEKTQDLESCLLHSEEKHLEFSNLLQEKELDIRELERRILQLKSRLRCQRHRPWQRTALRIIGEVCGASTAGSEHGDELRVTRNMKSVGNGNGGNGKDMGASGMSASFARTGSLIASPLPSGSGETGNAETVDNDDQNSLLSESTDVPPPEPDEERLFAQLAPIVVSSTRDMPDALTVLRDWANGCLEDLESLDDLKGGALSSRFMQFSEEIRNGVLLSRLLFYLALPRYQNKTAIAHRRAGGVQEVKRHGLSTAQDFSDNRRQLLLQHNVQLDSPFPTYTECFGDLLNLKPSGRMSMLLQFATELAYGPEQLGDENIRKRMARARESALKSTDLVPLPPAHRVEMQEIIDAYGLARGDRAAAITFIALLYVRFSHPFNHKARQSAMIERDAMLHLLSDGAYKRKDSDGSDDKGEDQLFKEGESTTPGNSAEDSGENKNNIARQLLLQLEEEERTPWQLFQLYCKPLINTLAHPFILRGNFWPSITFESPGLTRLLGALGLALQRSLQEHRWHITISCLVPVNTYSGLSRGVFTGLPAVPASLQAALDRDGDWAFAVGMPCVQTMLNERETAVRAALTSGSVPAPAADWQKDESIQQLEHQHLMSAFGTCGSDLLRLFLQRSSLTSSCAMPALDLGGWRLLWIDMGLVNPEDPEASPIDLEQISRIFFIVSTSLTDSQQEARRETVTTEGDEGDSWPAVALPLFNSGMYFPEFLAAFTLLAHDLFPPINTEEHSITWLGDAVSKLLFKHVLSSSMAATTKDPSAVLRRITSGAETQEVFLRYNKLLLVVFNSYCKDLCGVSGMEREQLLQLMRDAMLTSTEISQNLIFELFAPCSITKKTEDLVKEEKRREQDARPRDGVQRRRINVSILEPSAEQPQTNTRHKEFSLMLYDGFLQFLGVLCYFKQPNPLIPFEQRLDNFLKRGVLRPLAKKNETLSALLAIDRRPTKHGENM